MGNRARGEEMKAGFSAIPVLFAMAAAPSPAQDTSAASLPVPSLSAEEAEVDEKAVGPAPDPVAESDFEHLRAASPFTRVLDPSETYVLRGVAQFDQRQWATLYNRETKKTYVVDAEEANEVGLKLVEIVPPGRVPPGEELAAVTAKIDFAGEEVELKYDREQISPTPRQGKGGPGGSRGSDDGQRRGPSEEDRRRYESLSEDNRAKVRAYAGHVFRNYPNLSREEKGNMIRGAVIRLSDGRDLEIPSGDGGGAAIRVQPGGRPGGGPGGGGPQRPGGR